MIYNKHKASNDNDNNIDNMFYRTEPITWKMLSWAKFVQVALLPVKSQEMWFLSYFACLLLQTTLLSLVGFAPKQVT